MPAKDNQNIMVRGSVGLPRNQWEIIEKRVQQGEFPSEAEVIRAAIREYNERHPISVVQDLQGGEKAACPAGT